LEKATALSATHFKKDMSVPQLEQAQFQRGIFSISRLHEASPSESPLNYNQKPQSSQTSTFINNQVALNIM